MARSYCPVCAREWPKAPGLACPVDGTTLLSIARARDLLSGKLVVTGHLATVAGRKLARGGDDPYLDAVKFFSDQGFRSGDLVKIAGSKRRYQGETIFVVNRAQSAVKSKIRRIFKPALRSNR